MSLKPTTLFASGCSALLVLAACDTQTVGSRYVKSENVGASQGKTIAVSDKDSALLAGTSLDIPSGALAQDTVITLEVGVDSLLDADTAAGPVTTWGPAGTHFSKPARMTVPLTVNESGDEISVLVREADGTQFELPSSAVTLDAQGRATFTIDGFTSFQPMRRRPCMANAQCAQGQVCRNGRCRPATNECHADADCAAGQLCAIPPCMRGGACAGTCQPRPPQCMNCPPGSACVNGACATGCGGVLACPMGQTCRNNVCSSGCAADADCPNGQRCDTATRTCSTPPPQCGMNTACTPGSQCVNGACVALCDPNRPCPQGLVCDATNGLCVRVPPPTCTVNGMNTCAPGLQCVNGQCVGGCNAGTPCPMGQVCDPNTNVCRTPPQCQSSMDCNGQPCINGACVSGCGANGATCMSDEACMSGHCDAVINIPIPGLLPDTCGECSSSADCTAPDICSPNFDFQAFSGQKICVAPGSVENNNLCPEGAEGDLACMSGHCTMATIMNLVPVNICGECASDADCAMGQTCMPAEASMNGLNGSTCV